MTPRPNLTVPSFAKINWELHVLGVRPDGLHEVHTILQTITLHDDLTFERAFDGRISLLCDAPGLPCDETNSIHRAATALRDRFRVTQSVSVFLKKRIPAGGGLGGGSSNAAITLLALNYLWDIGATREELAAIAAGLGADVPFFLLGGTALAVGSGRDVAPTVERSASHMIVLSPSVAISTSDAYAKLDASALTKMDSKSNVSISHAGAKFPHSLYKGLSNDFEPVVFRLEPEIERARNALIELGARLALLAGSGSSVFAIFDNREAQERASAALVRETSWRVFSCATLGREAYLGALGSCAAVPRNALF